MVATPAVAGDLVVIGSCSGTLLALDRRDGRPRWTCDVRPDGRPISFHGDALVTDSLVVTATDAGTNDRVAAVWAVSRATGALRWTHAVRSGVVSDIVPGGNRVLAITRADSLLCLDLDDGRLRWSFAGAGGDPEPPFRSPAVAGGRVFFGDQKGGVHALDRDSGRPLWTRRIGVPVETGILPIGDDVILVDARGMLHRLDAASGVVRDSIDLGIAIGGPPVRVEDSLVVLAGEGGVACVDLARSRALWVQAFAVSSARPCVRDGAVIVGAQNGELLGLRLSDGATVWSRRPGGMVRGIGQDGATLYLGTQGGVVRALELHGGRH